MRAWKTTISLKSSHPRSFLTRCQTCKRICMAVFMDLSGLEARNRQSCSEGNLRSHIKTAIFRQGHFPHFQFSSYQVCNCLTEQHSLPGDCNIYSAGTAIDSFISKGAGVVMCWKRWIFGRMNLCVIFFYYGLLTISFFRKMNENVHRTTF